MRFFHYSLSYYRVICLCMYACADSLAWRHPLTRNIVDVTTISELDGELVAYPLRYREATLRPVVSSYIQDRLNSVWRCHGLIRGPRLSVLK